MINQVGLIELIAYKTKSIYTPGNKATFTFNVSNPQDTTVAGLIWFTLKQGANEQLVHPSLLNGQENPWEVTIPPGFNGDLSVKLSVTEPIQQGFYQFYVNSGQLGMPGPVHDRRRRRGLSLFGLVTSFAHCHEPPACVRSDASRAPPCRRRRRESARR